MVSLNPPVCNFDEPAQAFTLPGVDGQNYSLANARGTNGLLVMFICNHCPYVKAILDRLIRDTRALASYGIGSIAIMSNDTDAYPEDGWAPMKILAQTKQLPFPYVLDADQSVARAYGAVCTPDFFGYNSGLKLQYRGRLDNSKKSAAVDAPRELFDAMVQISQTGQGPKTQNASLGCSIKWRADNA